MRRIVLSVALLVLLAPATAVAHPERATFFPDHTKSSVPKLPSYKGGTQLVVCKSDSGARVRKIYASRPKLRAERLKMLKACKYEHIQAAVNAASSGAKILIYPGIYKEQPSREVSVNSPESKCGPLEIPEDGDAPVPSYEYQSRCPNARNLIAILGDSNFKDDNRRCDQKCNLLLRGMGAKPEDVVIEADRLKKDAIRVDRAEGTVLYNLTAEQASFNAIDFVEANGFRIEKVVGRYSQNYGVLTFASDNGLYDRVEAYGNGDSGIYPGSGPEGHCKRYGIEIRYSDVHDNNMAFSGTAGNGTWYHHNDFYDNGAGGANDSFATGHPGMPQDCSKWTDNKIHGNNWGEIYDDAHDKLCASTTFAERKREYVCPQFQIPVGTGIAFYGVNGNIVKDNYIYDQHRDGIRQFYVPAAIRGETSPAAQTDTSSDNLYEGNKMGVRPDGTRDPNGLDFYWDENGKGNCWKDNVSPTKITSDPASLPNCPGSPIYLPGNTPKLASQVPCATWDPKTDPNPPGCDWFTQPKEPK